jgi:hypothetical protein
MKFCIFTVPIELAKRTRNSPFVRHSFVSDFAVHLIKRRLHWAADRFISEETDQDQSVTRPYDAEVYTSKQDYPVDAYVLWVYHSEKKTQERFQPLCKRG